MIGPGNNVSFAATLRTAISVPSGSNALAPSFDP